MTRRALITGITGQDGSYLTEFLLEKGYEVHGIQRRVSVPNTDRIREHLVERSAAGSPLTLHEGDLSDSASLTRILDEVRPDEIYNLAAQSNVGASFKSPEHTADVNALGTLRLLEAVRQLGLADKTRFYQASTSELFGRTAESPQNEQTPFHPRSPYAVSKLYAYWICINYRESYELFACNGILFNHESPRRGREFVTRKITSGMAAIALGHIDCLYLGNLDSKRDWGHAKDYVRMKWLMLQQAQPDDFVIATGRQHSVREFLTWAAEDVGITLRFEGSGVAEVAIADNVDSSVAKSVTQGQVVVRIAPEFFRPAEVDTLLGDASKAKEQLGWEPQCSARELCAEMVAHDLEAARSSM